MKKNCKYCGKDIKCEWCGKVVRVYIKHQRFCSPKCRDKNKWERRKNPIVEKRCVVCNSIFKTSRPTRQFYCCLKCRKIAAKERWRKPDIQQNCQICGKRFVAKGKEKGRKYCGYDCWYRANYSPRIIEYEIRSCKYCNKNFKVNKKYRKEFCSELCRDRMWVENNREKLRKQALATYYKNSKEPSFVLSRRMSISMRKALKENKKGLKWETFVPYSLGDLINHFNKLLIEREMSWGAFVNGKIHIDHKLPLNYFLNYIGSDNKLFNDPTSESFQKAFALKNLQPLWAEDNLRKGYKILEEWGNISE